MLMIKPYGFSKTESNDNVKRRVLTLKGQEVKTEDIPTFAKTNPELLISQWISAIDKIARKPKDKENPTKEQFDLRSTLGEACWQLLKTKLPPNEIDELNKRLWIPKLHPYGGNPEYSKSGQSQGSWYAAFLGETPIGSINYNVLADRIKGHLENNPIRKYDGKERKKVKDEAEEKGIIPERANSIEKNILKEREDKKKPYPIKDEVWESYNHHNDIAKTIHEALQIELNERKDNQKGTKNKEIYLSGPVAHRLAAKQLFNHYGELFPNKSRTDVKKSDQEKLLDLHDRVKECYRRLFKDSRSKNLATIAPRDKVSLKKLIERQEDNQDINHQIRLGRIIHYHLLSKNISVDQASMNWQNNDIKESKYWLSDGQAEIKRKEAFVRVWHHTIGLMRLGLQAWLDPNYDFTKSDILDKAKEEKSSQTTDFPVFYRKNSSKFLENYQAKLPSSFELDEVKQEEFLRNHSKIARYALQTVAQLRHKCFHFAGFEAFVDILQSDVPEEIVNYAGYRQSKSMDRLKSVLGGLNLTRYLTQGEAQRIVNILKQPSTHPIHLPRFALVWKLGEKLSPQAEFCRKPYDMVEETIKKCGKIDGIEPHNPEDIRQVKQSRFGVMKLIYDGPFSSWLSGQGNDKLKDYVEKALERAKQNAKQFANEQDLPYKTQTTSRLAKLLADYPPSSFSKLWEWASQQLARELQIQQSHNRYLPDGEKAKAQANIIEKFRQEVVCYAFDDYLTDANLPKVGCWQLPLVTSLNKWKIQDLDYSQGPQPYEKWQAGLFFLLHLVPVNEVAQLKHQIIKFALLEDNQNNQSLADKLVDVFDFYVAMHDAQFEGGFNTNKDEIWQEFYESPELLKKIFENSEQEKLMPIRGLRELLRFGLHHIVSSFQKQHKITEAEVEEWETLRTKADQLENDKQTLHAKWVNNCEQGLENTRIEEYYQTIIEKLSRYRELHHRVMLLDPLKASNVMMAVLNRLGDFAHLWERDHYFRTLAILYQKKISFTSSNLDSKWFREGNIIKAYTKKSGKSKNIHTELKKIEDYLIKYRFRRHDLAHYNMLRSDKPNPPNLAHWINQTRDLMNYDRKLRNAVSKSIIDLMERENINLSWPSIRDRQALLENANITSLTINHLGGKLPMPAHSKSFIVMIMAMFKISLEPRKENFQKNQRPQYNK